MNIKRLSIIFGLALCIVLAILLFRSNFNRPFVDIRNNNISSIEIQDGIITMRGHTRSTLIQVYGYSHRIENDEMYVTVYLARTPRTAEERRNTRRRPSVEFVSPLPPNINKIFVEDNRHAILIWEMSQDYGEFDIEEHWQEEIRKLR